MFGIRAPTVVGSSKNCDQNGDRVSKYYKSCHIWSINLKEVLGKYEKYGTLSINDHLTLFINFWKYVDGFYHFQGKESKDLSSMDCDDERQSSSSLSSTEWEDQVNLKLF